MLPTRTTKTVQLSQGFEADESLGLFVKMLGIPYKELPSEAAEIHRLCKGNPFIISLIAGNMKEYAPANRFLKWKNILENTRWVFWSLTGCGIQNFHFFLLHKITRPTDTEYHKLIKESLSELSEENYQRFRSLVIFTNDVNIPASVRVLICNYPYPTGDGPNFFFVLIAASPIVLG